MTSPYERANAVCTDSGGGCGASQYKTNGGAQQRHLLLAGFKKSKIHFYLLCQQTVGEVDLTFSGLSLTAAERERNRQIVGLNRKKGQRRSEDRKKERVKLAKEMRRKSTEQCRQL